MAYKTGNRKQKTFLPPAIDDYVSKEDPVRVYDAFVNALDFQELGISIQECRAGADEYYPKEMLKLIIYGYSYGVRSSRKLERACHHNVSFMWLMGGLKPDYRTIARFRSNNKQAIKKVLKQCVKMCIELKLIEGNTLFTDGSPFRANASIKNTWTEQRCQKHLKKISKHIDKIMDESEHIDRQEEDQESLVKVDKELSDKKKLKEKIQNIASKVKESSKKSYNTTDSDSVKIRSRNNTHAGYNAQMTVDEKHGLIVNNEASQNNNDRNQFHNQIKKASKIIEKKPKVVSADSGYHSSEDLKKVDKDIKVVMPSQRQVQKEHNHPLGPFAKEQFKYNDRKDEYICPEGKRLKYVGYDVRKHSRRYKAKSSECKKCKHFNICTKSKSGRMITRLDQAKLMKHLEDIYKSPEGQQIYKLRGQKVELPFGHIKRNLGAGQFLLRGKHKVDAELSILSTCFNISRMITLLGIPTLILKLNGV